MEEKVGVESDTTLDGDGDEDPVGCTKGEVDDEDAEGDKVVCTMELDADCSTEFTASTMEAVVPAEITMTVLMSACI